jgi:hypothetical protein
VGPYTQCRRLGALLLIALELGSGGLAGARPKRDRGEPPPLRAADLAPRSERPQEADAIDAALENSEEKPAAAEPEKKPSGPPPVTCQPERPGQSSGEAKVVCSDGKSWTLRSAGLMLPTTSRCTTEHPECCQLGYGNMRELQLADLMRVGRGQSPVCHVRVQEVKTHAPVAQVPFDEDDPPPGVRIPQLGIAISSSHSCPDNMYQVSNRCYDTRELMRALKSPGLDDQNHVVITEAAPIVARLRQELDASGRCPDNADNAALLRLDDIARGRAANAPVDVTPLIAKAETPGLSKPEPQLPVACTYHAATQVWQQTSFHCTSKNLCFAQSQTSLPHNCIRFERATGQGASSAVFFPLSHCQDLPSCFSSRDAECTGVARLVALGSGVFLVSQEDAKRQRIDFSIVFARRRARTPVEIGVARQARTILHQIGRLYLSGPERERFNALIDAQPE